MSFPSIFRTLALSSLLLLGGCNLFGGNSTPFVALSNTPEQQETRTAFAKACPNMVPSTEYFLSPELHVTFQNDTLIGGYPNLIGASLADLKSDNYSTVLPLLYSEKKKEFRILYTPTSHTKVTAQLVGIVGDTCHSILQPQTLPYQRLYN